MNSTLKMKHGKSPRGKQKGFGLVELIIVIAIIAVLAIANRSGAPAAQGSAEVDAQKNIALQIKAAGTSYRNNRLNYATITMPELCTKTTLGAAICGTSNDGANTNIYGGSYSVQVLSGNVGRYQLTMDGLPEGVPALLADVLASYTAEESSCMNGSTGCPTISQTANSVTAIFK